MKRGRIKRWLKRLFLLAVVVCGAAYARWDWQRSAVEASIPKFECQTVSRGDLAQTVTASGELNPVAKVEIGSQVSGNIEKLLVDFNSKVKAGQVLAELDPSLYEANLMIAKGNLSNALAQLELSRVNESRSRELRERSLNAQAEYDIVLAELHQSEAAVQTCRGNYKKAEVDLARCTIYSPIDGMVIYRNVNVGQTVAASLSAPILMVIANDLTKMQIEANVVETDIGKVQPGQNVEFRVDAYPGERFKGKVIQVRNAPRETMNVVVYQTIVQVENPDLRLKPGMTATVGIVVSNREDTLKVPNTALRFRAPKELVMANTGDTPAVKDQPAPKAKSADSGTGPGKKPPTRKAGRTIYMLVEPEALPGTNAAPLLRAVEIKDGITDGSYTEVIEGLEEGDKVVTGMAKAREKEAHAFNPFAWNR